jgi:hypothetical protein
MTLMEQPDQFGLKNRPKVFAITVEAVAKSFHPKQGEQRPWTEILDPA